MCCPDQELVDVLLHQISVVSAQVLWCIQDLSLHGEMSGETEQVISTCSLKETVINTGKASDI